MNVKKLNLPKKGETRKEYTDRIAKKAKSVTAAKVVNPCK